MPPIQTWHLPTHHIGRRVLLFDSVASTNDIALEQELGAVVHADVQTAGRGRHGREWICPPGAGVQLSFTLDPPAELRRPVVLTAWAAVAIAETVRRLTGVPARIKWPNDVLLRGKKVAGILIEMRTVVVVGIGLNLNQAREQFDAAGLPDAGSLAEASGSALDRDAAIRQLVHVLDDDYGSILGGELSTLESRWVERLGLLGREVELETINNECHRGRLVILAWDGAALENTSGERTAIVPEQIQRLRQRVE